MPSLLGTTVAANYGRMTSQDTYGGVTFSNFGTRNLAFLKVVATTTTNGACPDFTLGTGTNATDVSAGTYADPLSYFSVAVRTIQQFAEVYFVGTPATTGTLTANGGGYSSFVVAVAIDTAADATSGNTENLSYPTLSSFGLLTAQLNVALATVDTLNANGTTSVAVGTGGNAAYLPSVSITQLTATGSSIAGSVTYS
jgi:hypothetical protein